MVSAYGVACHCLLSLAIRLFHANRNLFFVSNFLSLHLPHTCLSIRRVPINLAVLSLIESGELTELFNKWWFEKTHCDSAEKQDTARNELTLKNVAGIFFILIGGLIVSLIVALIEFFVNKPNDTFIQHQQSHHHRHHHNHQRMHHSQQQMHMDQQQIQIQQHNSVVQATDTMKSKLTIQPTCEYDNGTVGVS